MGELPPTNLITQDLPLASKGQSRFPRRKSYPLRAVVHKGKDIAYGSIQFPA